MEEVELSPGEQHIINCNENYKAYYTHKNNDFFYKETASER